MDHIIYHTRPTIGADHAPFLCENTNLVATFLPDRLARKCPVPVCLHEQLLGKRLLHFVFVAS